MERLDLLDYLIGAERRGVDDHRILAPGDEEDAVLLADRQLGDVAVEKSRIAV